MQCHFNHICVLIQCHFYYLAEKRAVLLAEINKLKSEGPQKRPQPSAHESTPSRGLISISEIFLPIKPDFICSTSQRPGKN